MVKFAVYITKFRLRDVVINAPSVIRILNYASATHQRLKRITYNDREIYPRNRIRSDLRLEIPADINREFNLYQIAPTYITVDVEFEPLIRKVRIMEITAYTNYVTGQAEGRGKDIEYKILRWVEYDTLENILLRYGNEMVRLFFCVFQWLEPYREDIQVFIGITNRIDTINEDELNEVKRWLAVGMFDTNTRRLLYAKEGLIEDIKDLCGAGIDVWINLIDRLHQKRWNYHPGINPFE